MMNSKNILRQATDFYNQEDYDSALSLTEQVLSREPSNTDALLIKGNIFYQKKRLQDSLQIYLQVLSQDPQNKIALLNAANSYLDIKDYSNAYAYAARFLSEDNGNKTALSILGNAAIELEKYDEAKVAFLHILQIDSQDVWAYNSLSRLYQQTQDYDRAFAYGWKAVELSHGDKNQHINFGYLLYEIDSPEKQKYARLWLEKYGADSVVNHMGNAILHNNKITRAEPEYVREIFDAFAEDFESVLASLDYRVPELMTEEIAQIYDTSKQDSLRILDAGCGTGLCGKALKKYALKGELFGVDISAQMLEQAHKKNCYDKLICSDLLAYFADTKDKFDLIVSADVMTYFGDLKKLFQGYQKILFQAGRILFSVSANHINDDDFYFHESGRYLHHQNYIKKLLSDNEFELEKISEKILRFEGDNEVMGYIVCAIKK